MPTIGLQVKTPDGVVVGYAVIGETGRITARLDDDYFIALREALLSGLADDICISPNIIPAERAIMDDTIKPAGEKVEAYMNKATSLVRQYVLDHLDKSDPVPVFDVYVVWFSKTLQNWKALVSTTLPDKMYYEVTYDGDLGQTYLDAYVKIGNQCISNPTVGYPKNETPGDNRFS